MRLLIKRGSRKLEAETHGRDQVVLVTATSDDTEGVACSMDRQDAQRLRKWLAKWLQPQRTPESDE